MTLKSISYKVTSGGNVLTGIKKVLSDFTKSENAFVLPMAGVLEIAMKHCTNDEQRGIVVAAMRNYKIDLSKVTSDTSRMPQASRPVDQNKVSKGLRVRIFRQGNRLTLTMNLDNVQKTLADLLTAKKSPLALAFLQVLLKGGLKPIVKGGVARR